MSYIFKNPVIFADYSDPDVIRSGEYFYLISSSFNFVPGVPVLRSRNLVEWELINHVVKRLPFERFDGKVCAGDGAWAPSIRYHNGKYYCVIPMYDDGVYVSETEDIEGEWSPLRPLIKKSGIIDPCPIWDGDKCYLAVGFARSRIGFNSAIGVYEVSPDLTKCISSDYTIVYDGKNDNPIIEGPKFYKRGKYFYILAPAGSVKSGWQVALRSENIYGPYESKVILMQGDSLVNGPHQGGLVQSTDGRDWFMHFQDRRAYGRIVHLQPVEWQDGWPVCGAIKYDGLCGTPVDSGEYPLDIKTDSSLLLCDNFKGKLSPMWQTPANPVGKWWEEGEKLKLFCLPYAERAELMPNALTTMVVGKEFDANCSFKLCAKEVGDEVCFGITGRKSAFISVIYTGQSYKARLCVSGADGEKIVAETPLNGGEVNVEISAKNEDIYRLMCNFSLNGEPLPYEFEAVAGVWVGARFILFARNKTGQSEGFAEAHYFNIQPKE
ncbi:MAG: family 43 glycosylhydrolase [Candidatus Coproplasma sp.]